jgi:hypothetical protein
VAVIGRTAVGGQTRQKVSKTPPQENKTGVVLHACHSSDAGGIKRRIMAQTEPGKKKKNL